MEGDPNEKVLVAFALHSMYIAHLTFLVLNAPLWRVHFGSCRLLSQYIDSEGA
jgi:hypothetical protein